MTSAPTRSSPRTNTSIAAITAEPAWSGEPQALLEAITIDPNGSMHIHLPERWTSYGAGRLGPGYRYEFTVPVDGIPTAFTVLQGSTPTWAQWSDTMTPPRSRPTTHLR